LFCRAPPSTPILGRENVRLSNSQRSAARMAGGRWPTAKGLAGRALSRPLEPCGFKREWSADRRSVRNAAPRRACEARLETLARRPCALVRKGARRSALHRGRYEVPRAHVGVGRPGAACKARAREPLPPPPTVCLRRRPRRGGMHRRIEQKQNIVKRKNAAESCLLEIMRIFRRPGRFRPKLSHQQLVLAPEPD
jgi:hypothetical protein